MTQSNDLPERSRAVDYLRCFVLVESIILLALIVVFYVTTRLLVDQLFDSYEKIKFHGIIVASALVSLNGMYAASNREKKNLRLWNVIYIFIMLTIFLYAVSLRSSHRPNQTNKKLEVLRAKLSGYMADYEWQAQNLSGPVRWFNQGTYIWDELQSREKCCGLDDPIDWIMMSPYKFYNEFYFPRSCCDKPENIEVQIRSSKNTSILSEYEVIVPLCAMNSELYSEGCMDLIRSNAQTIMQSSMAIFFIQVIFHIVLAFSINRARSNSESCNGNNSSSSSLPKDQASVNIQNSVQRPPSYQACCELGINSKLSPWQIQQKNIQPPEHKFVI